MGAMPRFGATHIPYMCMMAKFHCLVKKTGVANMNMINGLHRKKKKN